VRLAQALVVSASIGAAACASAPPPRTRAGGLLEARARIAREGHAPPATSTRAYRGLAARAIGSRCRMFPSDSEAYDARARRCGPVPAAALGASRLLLEVAASPDYLAPVVVGGRVLWLDPPDPTCSP